MMVDLRNLCARVTMFASSENKPVKKSMRKLRVLVVEDTEDAAQTLDMLLRTWGHSSWLSTSGSEALAVSPHFEPEVILIDIGLPDMTGWELAQRLPRGPLLIAITARGEANDYDLSHQVGIQYHLVKPAYQNHLREILERFGS
jgi:CheY-like chemotaxis protein